MVSIGMNILLSPPTRSLPEGLHKSRTQTQNLVRMKPTTKTSTHVVLVNALRSELPDKNTARPRQA